MIVPKKFWLFKILSQLLYRSRCLFGASSRDTGSGREMGIVMNRYMGVETDPSFRSFTFLQVSARFLGVIRYRLKRLTGAYRVWKI